MSKGRGFKPNWQKKLALERIENLFSQADTIFSENQQYAHTYVKHARNIGMRFRVPIPTEYKRKMCKHCYSFLRPGVNCTVRLNQKRFSKVVITCGECEKVTRIPIKN